ncbi:oxidoreductase [Synergistales bacterium]|nr:oxidoreductase [Synergistales bacterium]
MLLDREITGLDREPEIMVLRSRGVPLDSEHARIKMTASMSEALNFAPDCAVIASPTSEHAPQAAALAEHGAHLLIEKPMALSAKEAREITRVCRENKRSLLIAYNMAYLKPLRDLIRFVSSGGAGQVLSARAEVGQYLPDWRPRIDYRRSVSASRALGGGVIMELSHEIEYADRLIGGGEVVFCAARRSGLLDIDAEDTADIVMAGKAGAVASLHLDMLQRKPSRICRVTGTEGTISFDMMSGEFGGSLSAESSLPGGQYERGGDYAEQMRHFFACMRGEEEPLISGERGVHVMELIEAARSVYYDK